MNVRNSGNSNNGTDACFLDIYLIQAIIFIKSTDLYFSGLLGFMCIDDDRILIDLDDAVVYLADTDTSDVFVIINGTDEHLRTCIGISLGSRYIIKN